MRAGRRPGRGLPCAPCPLPWQPARAAAQRPPPATPRPLHCRPVADLEDYGLELPADPESYNSVGGFVFDALGRLPKRGDTVKANGYSIRVESVRENRIEAVRIRHRAGPAAPESE